MTLFGLDGPCRMHGPYFRCMPGRSALLLLILSLFALALFGMHLVIGPVAIGVADVMAALFAGTEQTQAVLVVRGVRLPEALTAVLAGSGLATCGLLMQTLFRNPLAGPSVLGLGSGASLGVAILMLARPLWLLSGMPVEIALIIGAFLGAIGVLALVMVADRRMGDGVALLIVGIMVGYVCGAIIDVLQVAGTERALKGYVLWGMGSFSGVSQDQLPLFGTAVAVGLLLALVLIKPLNAMLLGDAYAASFGVAVPRTRRTIMWTTGLLAGSITAFCGPIAFLGLATPHVARGLCRTGNHAVLLPVTMLTGVVLALLCGLIVKLPGLQGLPLNAVTSLLGAPVVAWVLWSGKHWARTA